MKSIFDKIEEKGISIYEYHEENILCGYELNTYTKGGVNQNIFIDFRRTGRDPKNEGDFSTLFLETVQSIDIDEQIESNRQDKRYREAFTLSESLEDFTQWHNDLLELAHSPFAEELENRTATKEEITKIAGWEKEKPVKATEITKVIYLKILKRYLGQPYREKETESTDPFLIAEAINHKMDYKYFDKDGNLFSINEIDNSIHENYMAIQQAKAVLKANGYYTDNLWSIEDVQSKFPDATDEQAYSILGEALANEATMEQIWFAIDFHAEEEGFEEQEEQEEQED